MLATDIRWLASAAASSWYALARLAQGCQLVDGTLADLLTPFLPRLAAATGVDGNSLSGLASHLAALAPGIANPRELAGVALAKLSGRGDDSARDALAGIIREVDTAWLSAHPRAVEELELRAAPLREQWEARGPGLLAGIGRRCGESFIAPSADVVLVHPVHGGGGLAHVPYNSVSFEAVLANPIAELPEIVRLAWLIAQLQLDLPAHQGELHRDVLARVGPLAMIPPALDAAADVELVAPGEFSLSLAISSWHVDPVSPAVLSSWWQTYLQSRPSWPVALAALESMRHNDASQSEVPSCGT